jgi:predicted lipoprotein
MAPSRRLVIAILAAGLPLAACKLVKNEPPQVASAAGSVATSFDNPAFDPEKTVEEIWQPRLLPYLKAKAGPFAEVRALALDEAGKRFGYRAVDSMPWTVATTVEGRITAADTATRAATIEVDADGDGTADLTVQIGPVFKGTALRDSIDFLSFNSFANQIEYAKFGKALNAHIYGTTLAALPRDKLVGQKVTLLGVFTLDDPKAKPLVTPAELNLGAAP